MSERRRIPVARPVLGELERRYVLDALDSGWISSVGRYVARFEEEFAAYCGTRRGVAVSNGTVGLHLALRSLDVRAGDEIVVPAMTFIAVPNAVRYLDAVPVLVDCDPRTWCLDPDLVEASISERTRGIIAVHSYGGVCDMDRLNEIAARRGLFVIEDAAEAHGATYRGRRVGGLGRVGVFSFYGNKIITTGEGGMLTTDDVDLADRCAFLKDHGMSKDQRYLHPEVGYNYRLTNLQAALGVAQLERIGEFIAARDRLTARYHERLEGIPGIAFQGFTAGARGVCWMYSVLITEDFGLSRDALIRYLDERGVETRPFFVALNEQPPYRTERPFPVSSRLARQGINLPSASDLSDNELDRVCELIVAARGAAV
jgi:perosamine synthetase